MVTPSVSEQPMPIKELSPIQIAVIKGIHAARGEITPGTHGFPSDNAGFKEWCDCAIGLTTLGYIVPGAAYVTTEAGHVRLLKAGVSGAGETVAKAAQ